MIQSDLRRAVAALAAQAGDGDWIINSIPSGIESQMLQDALIQDRICILKGQKAFYLAGTSSVQYTESSTRQIKNIFSVSSVPLW